MQVLIWGGIIFLLSFFIHIILWKIHLPKYQTAALLYIFFLTLFLSIVTLYFFPKVGELTGFSTPEDCWSYLHLALFVMSLTFAYIITYSALEADSPTLSILLMLNQAGPDGLEPVVLERFIDQRPFIGARMECLLHDNMAVLENGKYKTTPKGRWLAKLLLFYRPDRQNDQTKAGPV